VQKERKSLGARVWAAVGVVGVLAGALSSIPLVRDEAGRLLSALRNIGTIDLPGSYPGETWRVASVSDYRWLEDGWCFPTLRGFRSRFKLESDQLYRQSLGAYPTHFTTKWEAVEVFKSNSGVLRLRASAESRWNAVFISSGDGNASFRESERYIADDGAVTSGDKILALSCRRCSMSKDGLTYLCNGI
jgi:hypothetical protein